MIANGMGLGKLGSTDLIYKRKFRWTFKVTDICNGLEVPDFFVKVASRPSLTVEETEINRLNAKTWIPGKASWETITVTYYDVADTANLPLWTWLASVYNFLGNGKVATPKLHQMGSQLKDYGGVGVLTLYDGCGGEIERWTMKQMWPQAVNFGELDYSSSEECNIELTLRYSEVQYEPLCRGPVPEPCCTVCA